MTRWEYKVVASDTGAQNVRRYERQANEMGEEGWELCADTGGELVFKRPKPDSAESTIAQLTKDRDEANAEIVRLKGENDRLRGCIRDDAEMDTECRKLLIAYDKSDSIAVEPLPDILETVIKDLALLASEVRELRFYFPNADPIVAKIDPIILARRDVDTSGVLDRIKPA
jgi:hypothetical protein